KAYSHDLRERVVRACDEGWGTRPYLAKLFGVSTAWIRRLLQRRRETGSIAALPPAGGSPPKMDEGRSGRLLLLVAVQPDATLAAWRDRLGAPVHLSTVARTLARLGVTVKKSPAGFGAGPPRCAAQTRGLAYAHGPHRPAAVRVPR